MGEELKVPVVEIFYSIQGEGSSAGVPVVFVRTWGCTLHCRFNGISCDTPYAVYEERNKAKDMNVLEVVKAIKKLPSKHIVFTGGEPMLHQHFLTAVMKTIVDEEIDRDGESDYFFEIETNGTIAPTEEFKHHIDWFNVSLKLKSSNQIDAEKEACRINHESIREFPDEKSCFKFVMGYKTDMHEIEELTERYPTLPVFLMPMGETRKQQIDNMPMVADYCMIHGWKLSPRLHILIWDKKRGV